MSILPEDNCNNKMEALGNMTSFILIYRLGALKEAWMSRNPSVDFFTSPSNRTWNADETEKIQSRDIKSWDTSLLGRWLLEFPWDETNNGSTERMIALSPEEIKAVEKLRQLKNETKHWTALNPATNLDFQQTCASFRDSFLSLGIDQTKVEEMIKLAEIGSKVTQDDFLFLFRTSWLYEPESILAAGGFGISLKAKNSVDRCSYAVNLVPLDCQTLCAFRSSDSCRKIEREAEILCQLNHPNIVKHKTAAVFLLDADTLQNVLMLDGKTHESMGLRDTTSLTKFKSQIFDANISSELISGFYSVTELYEETLKSWITNKERNDTDWKMEQKISKQVLDGLLYIQGKNIIHRNLRPENIFFDSATRTNVKIGNFGLPWTTSQLTAREYPVNDFYAAPEVTPRDHSHLVDNYAFGIILFDIFALPSFYNHRDLMMDTLLTKQRIEAGTTANIRYLKEVIIGLTTADPVRRLELRSIPNFWDHPAGTYSDTGMSGYLIGTRGGSNDTGMSSSLAGTRNEVNYGMATYQVGTGSVLNNSGPSGYTTGINVMQSGQSASSDWVRTPSPYACDQIAGADVNGIRRALGSVSLTPATVQLSNLCGGNNVFYTTLNRTGPDHVPIFRMQCNVEYRGQSFVSEGEGGSKSIAKAAAAEGILRQLNG